MWGSQKSRDEIAASPTKPDVASGRGTMYQLLKLLAALLKGTCSTRVATASKIINGSLLIDRDDCGVSFFLLGGVSKLGDSL
jgi:hypothetical protein